MPSPVDRSRIAQDFLAAMNSLRAVRSQLARLIHDDSDRLAGLWTEASNIMVEGIVICGSLETLASRFASEKQS